MKNDKAGNYTIPGVRQTFRTAAKRDAFIEAEFRARRKILRDMARPLAGERPAGLLERRQARARVEADTWRSLQEQHLGDELRQWDRQNSEAAMENVDLVEQLDAQRHADEMSDLLELWRERETGRNRLLED